MLKTDISRNFLDLFYQEIKDHDISGFNTKLNLHILKITNNKFDYHKLVEDLHENIVTYCLSPRELDRLQDTRTKSYRSAIQKLKDHGTNDGELGEILLYCLLESHLGAPKLLSKMQLKTSNQDYVKGADGIHLLEITNSDYQIVFGESKLNKKFQRGLYEAFKSINDFITRDKNNINHEIELINTHLGNEVVSEEMYLFLKKIIFPSAQEDEITTDNAFGILIGFDLPLDDQIKRLPNSEFRKLIRQKVKEMVEKEFDYIQKKIEEYELFGYQFYIYAIPFIDLMTTRKRVIKNLKGADNDY